MAQPLFILGAGKITHAASDDFANATRRYRCLAPDTEQHRPNLNQCSRLSACFELESSSQP
ncbi:MAG: hypothetical protein C1943_14315 [Halochromatium sp.]|nr:hypothetical protein [Halochromatium sp.]